MSLSVSSVLMSHPRRAEFVPELQAKLDRPAQVVWDERNDRWHTGRRSWLAVDRDASHGLVLQDDAIIPRDLVAGIETALEHVPDGSPLSLYCGRTRPYRELVQRLVSQASDDASWLTMTQLHWGVGIVMPTKLIDDMIAWCDQRTDVANYDKRISRWCQHRGLTVYYPWPSLVDHRDSPSLVPNRGSAGRRAHRFIGAEASVLERRWDGEIVSIPALSLPDRPAPGQIGGPPLKFISVKYPDYHIPTIGVRFRPTETAKGTVGVAEATTRGAIAYLQTPWMRRRGIRLAEEVDLAEPTPAVPEQQPAPAGEAAETATEQSVPRLPEPTAAREVEQSSPDAQPSADTATGVVPLGGGWFGVQLGGEQVAKIRGEQAAMQRLEELTLAAAGA